VLRYIAAVTGWLLVALGVAGVIAHFSGWANTVWARAAAFTPLMILGAVVGLILLGLARFVWSAVVALVVVVVGLATQVPLFVGADEHVAESDLRVMQANIYLGQADTTALARLADDRDIDVLTVVELTPDAARRIETTSLRARLPFAYLDPREGGSGSGIYSRYPLSDTRELTGLTHANLRAVVTIPGVGRRALYALHPIPPYPEPAWKWQLELRRLGEQLRAEPLPLIIGTDVNSTYDHRPFRDLLAGSDAPYSPGLTDAADHLGAGIVATYPANRAFPPMLALDRVLTRGGPVPTGFEAVDLPGSDHRGVVATVRP